MNYYKRYIGDYQRDTGHLSLAEHGAYTLMLDIYYATEQPLLPARQALYRLLRVSKPSERLAVESVLTKFWTETPDGWVNGRADEEIEKSNAFADKQGENGRKGGRPKPQTNPQHKPKRKPNETPTQPKHNPNEPPTQTQTKAKKKPNTTQTQPKRTPNTNPNESQKKALHSHNHNQNQEPDTKATAKSQSQKKKETTKKQQLLAPTPTDRTPGERAAAPSPPPPAAVAWAAYAAAYVQRYGATPVRNAKINGQLAHLVARLGRDDAPPVAAFYVHHHSRWYVEKGHAVDCLLKDCEKLRTEWATGTRMTSATARRMDRTAANLETAQRVIDRHTAKRKE